MATTYTATVAIIDPDGNVLLTAAQATDTLAGLIEWGQMTRDDIETPAEPLTVEKVYNFLTQAFSLHKIETLTIEPAPEGTSSTLDDLENFAIRRQEGYEPTEEEFEEKMVGLRTLLPPPVWRRRHFQNVTTAPTRYPAVRPLACARW